MACVIIEGCRELRYVARTSSTSVLFRRLRSSSRAGDFLSSWRQAHGVGVAVLIVVLIVLAVLFG
jgi:hypothetical protein